MKKAGLIGLGIITKCYVVGLQESPYLELCAVSDVDPNAHSRSAYAAYPFYTDYKEMIATEKPDFAIISTPPKSHFDIARYCLEHDVNVIIEKPVVLCIEEFDTLCQLAHKNGLLFKTLFHWQGGIELLAFGRDYNATEIRRVKATVLDPYSDDGVTITPDRRPLMGAWIDSGVNILSMLKLWLPFKQTEIGRTEAIKCRETGLPLYAHAELLIDGVEADITVDWRKGRNHKESVVTMTEETICINHSAQSIVQGDKTANYTRMERLDEHYYRLFRELDESENDAASRLIHKLLLEVNRTL